jgi:acid phosphatase family membrane protein YuiD
MNAANFTPYLFAIVVAWLGAHIVKYVIATIQGKRLDLVHQIFVSGGMPSAHAATVIALATVIGLRDGIWSGLFAVSALLALIVCHDAVKVRRASGEQGEAITTLIAETKSKAKIPYNAKGHTPLELTMGIVFGVLVGFVVFFASR